MFTKFARFVAVLAVIASAIGNSGVAYAERGAPAGMNVQNLQPPRASQPQQLDLPALILPPASSKGVQFVHVATAANSAGDYTIIDHPLTNGKPNAILIVTPNWNPGGVGGMYNNRSIGVFYTGSQWAIFNQNFAAMPAGAAFNVIIPTTGSGVFVHTATAGNSAGDYTIIDNPLTNGNPNAMLFVTPNWNPGGVGGTYNNHSIGVWYTGSRWAIFNQDHITAIPVNAAFNVSVLTAGTGIFVHKTPAGDTSFNDTVIDNALTNNNPNAIIFVTPNYNPGGVGGIYDDQNIGVWYNGSKWAIFNQDTMATMPLNAAFNVLVLVPASDVFVHTATAGNSAGDYTRIDNALTNSHPNAIVFATPNFNPGGGAGVYSDYNIGVWYDNIFGSNQWAIFNQDGATPIPAGTAFNVLVPNPDTSVFVHKVTADNSAGDYTVIDNPLTNGNPSAMIFVTPNYNPGGVGGRYNNHPISVGYLGSKWLIINEDFAAMPVGASFNVGVHTAGPESNIFVQTSAPSNIWGTGIIIDNPLTNGNPNAIITVTPRADGTINSYPIGVWYNGSHWIIFNQHGPTMATGVAFNVYVVPNYKLFLPLVIR